MLLSYVFESFWMHVTVAALRHVLPSAALTLDLRLEFSSEQGCLSASALSLCLPSYIEALQWTDRSTKCLKDSCLQELILSWNMPEGLIPESGGGGEGGHRKIDSELKFPELASR
jgi:hypothetical protein